LGDERRVTYLERPKDWRTALFGMLRDDDDDSRSDATDGFATLGGRGSAEILAGLTQAREVLSGPAIQVRCLNCPAVAPAKVSAADLSWFERLVRLLG
jgi:protease-4